MQENGGWMLKFFSETEFVEASKSSGNRKRNRVQALNLKEPHSTSGCFEETKLEKDGRVDTPPVDYQGLFTLGAQIRKSKKMKCVVAEEAVNIYIDAQVKNKCDTGSVKNEIFESKNASVVRKVESKRSTFLIEMEVTHLAVDNENPALLKRDSSNNMPQLDTQTLFGNGKMKTKSQKQQKRPVEALESTCQLKEGGSNYRPLLNSQTLLYFGMKKTKSQKKQKRAAEALESTCQLKEDGSNYEPLLMEKTKPQTKRKTPTEALESTRQLKEDGGNYRPLLDSQTFFGNGTKKTKSQKKWKRPAEALDSTCQLKEDGSNYRPLLDTQTLLGTGTKKTKSQKKGKTPAEAVEGTCQLKEDGSNYTPLLGTQTLSCNSTKKTKSQKKRKTPAEALGSTCQLKEDGSNYRPLLDSQTLSGNGKKKRKSRKKRKRDTGALKSTCQLTGDASNYRPPLDSHTLSCNDKKKNKSQKKQRRPAEALESTCQRINIEEGLTKVDTHTLTTVSSSLKRYTERTNAASMFYEATDSEAVGYSDSCANKQVTNQKRKKSKKKRNADVRKPDVCCEHLRIESTCNVRTFGEQNTHPKIAFSVTKNKQSKVEQERKLSRALLRMTFIVFPKLVSTMACPIRRHKSKLSKA